MDTQHSRRPRTETPHSQLMYLLIEEDEFESYYLAHGDPISVHWTEEEAEQAATALREQYPDQPYKVIPVPLAISPAAPLVEES